VRILQNGAALLHHARAGWGRDQALKLYMRPEALARGDFSEVIVDVS